VTPRLERLHGRATGAGRRIGLDPGCFVQTSSAPAGLALGALAAAATFQALRVPVGRAASWLVDR
jgi:hypothetical protein